MSRREDVDTAIWEDEDFDGLSDDAAFLYLWSFTNSRCGMGGVYQVKARHICEGRLTPERREAALKELAQKRFVYYVDGWLWVRTRIKYLRTKGEKIALSILRDFEKIPDDHRIRRGFIKEYGDGSWFSGWLKQALSEDPSKDHPGPIDGSQGLGKGKGRGKKKKGSKGAKANDPNALPADADPRLAAAVEQALPALRRTAAARDANLVTAAAVYRAVESFPTKRHAEVAGEVEHWTVHGNGAGKPAKDIVARFRNFLSSAPDAAPALAAVPSPTRPDYDATTREVRV